MQMDEGDARLQPVTQRIIGFTASPLPADPKIVVRRIANQS
jgi:hypothetical protein